MTSEPLYTIEDAARELDTYGKLVRSLIQLHDIPHRMVGRLVVIGKDELKTLRPLVRAWHDRPRVSRGMVASRPR